MNIGSISKTIIACCAILGSACGPAHLSALGNPGDFCTERTSCDDGTQCLQTDEGFRCVDPNERDAPRQSQPPTSSDDEVVSDISEPDDTQTTTSDPAAGDASEEYLPPSRRRRDGN